MVSLKKSFVFVAAALLALLILAMAMKSKKSNPIHNEDGDDVSTCDNDDFDPEIETADTFSLFDEISAFMNKQSAYVMNE